MATSKSSAPSHPRTVAIHQLTAPDAGGTKPEEQFAKSPFTFLHENILAMSVLLNVNEKFSEDDRIDKTQPKTNSSQPHKQFAISRLISRIDYPCSCRVEETNRRKNPSKCIRPEKYSEPIFPNVFLMKVLSSVYTAAYLGADCH
jgi:hypothetical protein